MKLKLPSLQVLGKSIAAVMWRFPFELLFALCGTVAAWLLIGTDRWYDKPDHQGLYVRLMMTANLGLLLSLAATLYTESKGMAGITKLAVKIVVSLLGAGTLWLFNPDLRGFDVSRFFILSFALHLVVAFAGFTPRGQVAKFWQFNKSIFLRFLTTVLYSGVLYAGLCAAIGSATFLFGLKTNGDIYLQLGALIGGLFNTLFFLAGVPVLITGSQTDTSSYPAGLKMFTQYVLIPLAVIYVVILLSYEVKIIVQWSLPKGLVSSLILGYAVFGILSILLVYPIRNHDDSKWIKIFSRSFYFLLIPLIVLLFVAVGARIFPYGITPQRYFLLVLGLWLIFITGYFLMAKQQNIKIIPVSLAIVSLLSLYGPQSALAVSVYSQSRRLIYIFKKNGAITAGKFTRLTQKNASQKDGRNALDQLTFLTDYAQLDALQPYFKDNIQAVQDSIGTHIDTGQAYVYRRRDEVSRRQLAWASKKLGLAKYDANNELQIEANYLLQTGYDEVTKVSGYDYVLNTVNSSFYTEGTYTLEQKIDGLHIVTQETGNRFILTVNGESAAFDMNQLAGSFIKDGKINTTQLRADTAFKSYAGSSSYYAKPEVLSVTKETPHYQIALSLNEFRFDYYSDKTVKATSAKGLYLIKKKGG